MLTLADSLLSSSARKISIRKRPDLTARRQRYHGRVYWVVKEPVGLNYFRFQEEEYAILQMLDGDVSLDEIKDEFEEQFPPQKITLEELQQFLGMLHRSGLVVAAVPGQGRQLVKRRRERRRKEILAALGNILCIRFKGIDPERMLKWLYTYVKWFFHPVTVCFCLLFGLSALMLVLVEFDTFRSKLPEFHQFFSLYNAFLLTVTLAFTKVLHEFGHGLTCRHFGGECHELGVMILVLTPCLYCNVSDSWMLPNKWHRAAIGAAGMYVELVLASICTYIWWFSQPGLLNNLCLNVMFISSVSTLMFNANPLLRYDGYYILSDITEIPNLRQKATSILGRKASEWFLGLEPQEDPFLPERNQIFFALYTIAAVIYRWVIMLSILYFLYKIFEPYGLKVIGQMIALASLWAILGQPLYNIGKFLYVPGRYDKVKKPRLYATLAGVAAIIAALFVVPLPYHVIAPLEVDARDAASIYVTVPGRLEKVFVHDGDPVPNGKLEKVSVHDGDNIRDGWKLAQLSNVELNLKITELEDKCKYYSKRLENIARVQIEKSQQQQPGGAQDPNGEIRPTEEALKSAQKELAEKRRDYEKLQLVALHPGTVMPPHATQKREDPDGQLPAWSGTPLEPQNRGAFLPISTLFCQIGDPQRMEAILVIDQSEIELVRPGQKVDVKLEELPGRVFTGQIEEIAPEALRVAPKALSTKYKGELATKTDPTTGVERPMSPCYQARVPLEEPKDLLPLLRLGLTGQAKIYADPQTCAARAWRALGRTFNFKL
jgi:putative peptide zinc metalloprotease protein